MEVADKGNSNEGGGKDQPFLFLVAGRMEWHGALACLEKKYGFALGAYIGRKDRLC